MGVKKMKKNEKQELKEKQAFDKAVVGHLNAIWTKFKNPLFPDEPAKYPARITIFEKAKIHGETMTFRMVVERIDEAGHPFSSSIVITDKPSDKEPKKATAKY
jgi:hypothetical protein